MASFSGAKSPSLHPLTRGCKEVTTEKASHRLKKEGETEILTPLTGGGGQTKTRKFRLVEPETKLSFAIEDYRPAEVITLDIETRGLDPHTGRRLLQDHHLACLTVIRCLETIEINATGHRLTIGVTSIPVDGTLCCLIIAGWF